MSEHKPPQKTAPRGAKELLEYAKIHTFRLKGIAHDIRNRDDYYRPAVRAMLETDLLLAMEFLQEIETYLRQHLPKAQLIAFPSNIPTE